MPSIIRLDQQVADLIAAGEVVERPASAAKELIENSLDALAKNITVEIQGGGIALMRVTDDGKGIPAGEEEVAFLRHATSKLRTKEDLEEIVTMGFRGEALAAIAAVSKVEILTKSESAPLGRRVMLAGGAVLSNEEAGCPKGTTILLRELFYNTPARHKFLKKDVTEAGYVLSVCQKAAMARPDVAFRLIKNGEMILQTPGDGQLLTVLYCLFGNQLASCLLPLSGGHEGVLVSGFVGRPEAARGSRAMQYFLVNGRPVRNGTLQSAVEQAFRKLLTSGRFPAAFLDITVNPRLVDVNIHPAKTEVKFAREKDVFDAVYFAVKTALEKSGPGEMTLSGDTAVPAGTAASAETAVPEKSAVLEEPAAPAAQAREGEDMVVFRESTLLVRGDLPENPPENSSGIYKKHKNSPWGDGIIDAQGALPSEMRRGNSTQGTLPKGPADGMVSLAALGFLSEPGTKVRNDDAQDAVRPAVPLAVEVFEDEPAPKSEPWHFLGEAMGTYILAERGDSLCLMDKHAAHERLVYERLKKEAARLPAQLLLEAPVVHLAATETAVLLENRAVLDGLGFAVEEFGGVSLRLLSIPSVLDQGESPEALLSELAGQLAKGKEPGLAKMDGILSMLACKSAVRANDKASPRELMHLFEQVIGDETLWHCAHGRPTLILLTRKELEKQFKRLV